MADATGGAREPPYAAAIWGPNPVTRLRGVSEALEGLPDAAQRRMIKPPRPAIWRFPDGSQTLGNGEVRQDRPGADLRPKP